MQFYSDVERESDARALPDCEAFRVVSGDVWNMPRDCDDKLIMLDPGWYWWSCFPGCLPDSDPFGPFDSEALAIADARERN